MIIRQFCARHGRTVLAQSPRRAYATSISVDNPSLRPSERDPKSTSRLPGHPDDPSSVVDTIGHAPTVATRTVEQLLDSQQHSIRSLQADVNAHAAARIMALSDLTSNPVSGPVSGSTIPATQPPPSSDPFPFQDLRGLNRFRRLKQQQHGRGTHLSQTYHPENILRNPPKPEDLTLPMLLANQTHLGHATSLWNPSNSGYIFGIRNGIHIISLDITYAYLKRAAKVVQEVARKGGIILFIGTRKGTEDVVVNSARLAESYHIFHRWVPGLLTNGQQILGNCGVKIVNIQDRELTQYRNILSQNHHTVMRPDLVVCMNPIENEVCLRECGTYNIPTIGVIDTDANPTWVTYPIPANDDSFRSIALIGGVLGQAGKEGQRLRRAEAARGRATYDTKIVSQELLKLEDRAEMNVQVEENENAKD